MVPAPVELTADLGELPGPEGRRHDEQLLRSLTTAHIACGGHAGDLASMAASVDACGRHGVRIGAHPSYPDRDGFGRRSLGLDPAAVAASVVGQVVALREVAAATGRPVSSVKPHGQLYHDLSADLGLAEVVLGALREAEVPEVLLAAGSPAAALGRALGLVVGAEGFCDRRYDAAGGLVARGEPGAVLEDPAEAAAQAVALVADGLVVDGTAHRVTSLCVHSDSPGAVAILEAVRAVLEAGPASLATFG